MSRSVTPATIVQRVQDRGEFLNSYISTTTLTDWASESAAELYDIICGVTPEYFISTTNVTVVAGTATYALPSDFYKCVGLDVLDRNGYWRNMERFQFGSRNNYQSMASDRNLTRYSIKGSNILLVPTPNWTSTLKLWYLPNFTSFSTVTTTFDGVNGWDEFIVADLLVKCAMKEESDPGPFLAQKEAQRKRIIDMCAERDLGEPEKIRDVQRERGWASWPSYWNP